ncbi:MAG: hypothetical protein ACOWWM_15335 [Desulfobacterales bacterium]
MDYFKVFDSGHLNSTGRIILIAAVHGKISRYIIEIYAFSFYDESIFEGVVVGYDFDASEIIDDEFRVHVINLIHSILAKVYKERKIPSKINQYPDCKEIDKSILLTMKSMQFHTEKYNDISRKSNCESLKTYLTRILSLPSITIKKYK